MGFMSLRTGVEGRVQRSFLKTEDVKRKKKKKKLKDV